MDGDERTLSYQPRKANHRRLWRWGSIFVLIALICLSWANRAGLKKSAALMRERWMVRKCERYQLPPDTVVYETDPLLAKAYAGNPLYEWVDVDPPYLIRDAQPLYDYDVQQKSIHPWGGAIFCHSRTSKSGHHRLVVVDGFDTGRPDAMVIDPGSFWSPSAEISNSGNNFPRPWHRYEVLSERGASFASLSWAWKNNPAFTMYAGQPDPNDDSHFTFRYVAKTGTGTVDAWLLDNDKVRFRAIDGPFGHPLSYFIQKEKDSQD